MLQCCCLLGVGPLKPIRVVKWDWAATSSWKHLHAHLQSMAVVDIMHKVVVDFRNSKANSETWGATCSVCSLFLIHGMPFWLVSS
jgi:hypothetical protein